MQTFNTRKDMLTLVPPYGICVELGVFNGNFSQDILGVCNPASLYLVDMFPAFVSSGDQDGNNVVTYPGRQLHEAVLEKFSCWPNVFVLKDTTQGAAAVLPRSLDMVYIDADHSYGAVMTDLTTYFDLLRPGGWLMGHDYEVNPAKTSNNWQFGVKNAVDDFCQKYNQKIAAKALDGLVSFAIRVDK